MPNSVWRKSALIGLIGNPNAGKTSVFNALTGMNAKVGNYAGVTVEKHSGTFQAGDIECEIVDIPGLYTLNALSKDEEIAAEAIRGTSDSERPADIMVVAIDAVNLERNLFFFSQVIQLQTPIIVVLTMTDLLGSRGMSVDLAKLEEMLGVPVVAVVAHKRTGIAKLKMAIQQVLESGQTPPAIEFSDIKDRYRWAESVFHASVKQDPAARKKSRTDKIDKLLTHRFFGLVFFLFVMYALFQSVYTLAKPLMEVIENVFDFVGDKLSAMLAPIPWLQSLIVDGILAGVGGVAVFLPQILILFGLISVLEGSGYLARASFLMDKLLSWCGLNGKAFIPLLSSFACAIPGIMAARIMPDSRSRLLTILIAPLMSCSARLPVYVLLIGAIIEPKYGPVVAGLTLFAMHSVGVIMSIPIIILLNRKVLRANKLPFSMELPPYQMPKWRDVFNAMVGRGKVFLQTAGTVIIVMSVIIWGLLYFPRSAEADARYLTEYRTSLSTAQKEVISEENYVDGKRLENSILGNIGRAIEPAFAPAGFDWRISTAILAAFPAREVLVSSLGIIFDLGSDQDEESNHLRGAMREATWPDGRPLLTTGATFALMVFFALCSQCGATLATIKRETNTWKWPIFTFVYMTTLAYLMAVLVNQTINLFSK